MRDFKAGDKVTIHQHWHGPVVVTTVEKAGKLRMTLAGHGEWRTNGYRPGKRGYTDDRVESWKPEDDVAIEKRRLVRRIEAMGQKWETLPIERLRAIAAELKEA